MKELERYFLAWKEKGGKRQTRMFKDIRDLERFELSLATHAKDNGIKIKMIDYFLVEGNKMEL